MRTTHYKFEEIKTTRKKKYVDEDGKKRQVTRPFSQTLNPFNKVKSGKRKGAVKIESEIWAEINKEADRWMASEDLEKWGSF